MILEDNCSVVKLAEDRMNGYLFFFIRLDTENRCSLKQVMLPGKDSGQIRWELTFQASSRVVIRDLDLSCFDAVLRKRENKERIRAR